MKPLLLSLASKKWTRLAEGELGYPSWSRDSKFIYLQGWSHGSPHISRLRLSHHTLEVLKEFSDVKSALLGFITTLSGAALDGSPLVARDTSNQEIYALKLSAP